MANTIGNQPVSTVSTTDPFAPRTAATNQDTQINKNMFMQLLVAQIKNQDPLNPSDGAQFLTQLAQFQTLENGVNMAQDIAAMRSDLDSLSTTTGQQKGTVADMPAAKPFPFPYNENFESYGSAQPWGYLPHYFADIDGVFELADRPDGAGKCLRQVISQKAQSWAPEWSPYTIIGDEKWTDYEVSADVFFDGGGSAGVMGRVNNVGGGYGSNPKAYCLRLQVDGTWSLTAPNQQQRNASGVELKTGKLDAFDAKKWHNVKLQFAGTTITALLDDAQVASVTDATHRTGMVGLFTGAGGNDRNTALFDNLIVRPVGSPAPAPTAFPATLTPMYAPKATSPRAGLPANFPDDLPLMPALALTGASQSDPAHGTGRVTLSGAVTREAAVAFFDKSMKDQEWSEDESRADGDHWVMSFTKNKLKATITFSVGNGATTATILWETQQ